MSLIHLYTTTDFHTFEKHFIDWKLAVTKELPSGVGLKILNINHSQSTVIDQHGMIQKEYSFIIHYNLNT